MLLKSLTKKDEILARLGSTQNANSNLSDIELNRWYNGVGTLAFWEGAELTLTLEMELPSLPKVSLNIYSIISLPSTTIQWFQNVCFTKMRPILTSPQTKGPV